MTIYKKMVALVCICIINFLSHSMEMDATYLLRAAALNEDPNAMKEVLKNFHIDTQDENGDTALIKATRQKLVQAVKNLIDAEANTDIVNNEGYSALMIAASLGYTEIVNELIYNGNATLNLINKQNNDTALLLAARHKHLEIIRELIEAGAGLNQIKEQFPEIYKLGIISTLFDPPLEFKPEELEQNIEVLIFQTMKKASFPPLRKLIFYASIKSIEPEGCQSTIYPQKIYSNLVLPKLVRYAPLNMLKKAIKNGKLEFKDVLEALVSRKIKMFTALKVVDILNYKEAIRSYYAILLKD